MGKPIEVTTKEQETALFNRLKGNEAKAIDFNIESLSKMEAGLVSILYEKDVSESDLEKARSIAKQHLHLLRSQFRRLAEKNPAIFEVNKHRRYQGAIDAAIENIQGAIDSIETRLARRKSPEYDISGLYSKLVSVGYIFDTSLKKFSNAIKKGDMPTSKTVWSIKRGMPAQAISFCDYLGYDLGYDFDWWNNHFELEGGKRLNSTYRSVGTHEIESYLAEFGFSRAKPPKPIERF